MGWELLFLMFVGGLIVLLMTSLPVAFAFLGVNIIGAALLIGFEAGGLQVTRSISPTIMNFSLLPIPLFVFMGELLFHSGLASRTLDGVSKWFGKVPGRLALVTQAGGASFSVFSGSSLATTSMLGSLLVPEMRKRGYSVEMSAGAILAAGGLAMVIPPSAIIVLVGTIGHVSIGRLLLAGIIPGILLAVIAMGYIVIRCWRNPSLAPPYDVGAVTWNERWRALFVDILPLGSVLVTVLGLIILGIGTPTEAAAVGSVVAAGLIACYGNLTLENFRKAVFGTLRIAGGILFIVAGAAGFSQLVAYSGAISGLIDLVSGMNAHPLIIVAVMLIVLVILGSPLEHISI
ncbi:MAG: TRAP transporter large permease subunit, partial [Phycisphaeraceae bacterium]